MRRSQIHSYFVWLILGFTSGGIFASDAKKDTPIPKECIVWFEKANIGSGKSCPIDCALIESDMGTFDCSRFCQELCTNLKKSEQADFGFKLSSLYPGLTDAERNFADKNPQVAVQAYWLSWRAESLCKGVYFVSDTNDESDACRHFIWAALLNAKFGSSLTTELLDAHELNPDQSEEEKSMDLANNRRGLIASTELIKNNRDDNAAFLKQFLTDLKDGKIVVLKRRKK